MKQILILGVISSTLTMYGIGSVISLKKPFFLVDAPADLTVEKDGEEDYFFWESFSLKHTCHSSFISTI